jgi:hypothetical protein
MRRADCGARRRNRHVLNIDDDVDDDDDDDDDDEKNVV